MTVRAATEADIPRIVDMAQRFYAVSGYERIAPLAKESAAGLAILTMDSGVMLVAEVAGAVVGMVCMHVEPYLFNVDVTIAQEIVWWLEPEARGGVLAVRLKNAAEEAAKAKGARWCRMAVLPDSPPQALALLERTGYGPSEAYLVKELT